MRKTVLEWHLPPDLPDTGSELESSFVRILVIVKTSKWYELFTKTFYNSDKRLTYAGEPVLAWAYAGDIFSDPFAVSHEKQREWIEFLHQNAVKK